MVEVKDLNSSIKVGPAIRVKTTNYTFIPLLTFLLFIDEVQSNKHYRKGRRKSKKKNLAMKFRQYSPKL